MPFYPGQETFRGEQLHTVDFPGPEYFRGKRTLVVGGGASAVQLLGEIRPVTDTLWVTRSEPVWRDRIDEFDGRAAIALVEERVRRGLPPSSVVSVTGIGLRAQEQEAARLGAYERRPMFSQIEPDGVRWADGTFEPVDVILWATGFRPASPAARGPSRRAVSPCCEHAGRASYDAAAHPQPAHVSLVQPVHVDDLVRAVVAEFYARIFFRNAINTATAAQLETLPRIGPAMARRILDYRAQRGAFTRVDELGNVKGIGAKTLENLRPLVTLD